MDEQLKSWDIWKHTNQKGARLIAAPAGTMHIRKGWQLLGMQRGKNPGDALRAFRAEREAEEELNGGNHVR